MGIIRPDAAVRYSTFLRKGHRREDKFVRRKCAFLETDVLALRFRFDYCDRTFEARIEVASDLTACGANGIKQPERAPAAQREE